MQHRWYHAYLPLIKDRPAWNDRYAGTGVLSNTWDMNLRASGCLNAVIARALKKSWSNITSDTSLSMATPSKRTGPPKPFGYHLTPETDNSEYKNWSFHLRSLSCQRSINGGFGRNTMVSLQVWSSFGYPGDAYYRDFHKQPRVPASSTGG